jgi:hypothetical protein
MINQIRYNLHHKLKICGNRINAKQRWIVKRTKEVSANETRWLKRLNRAGYGISDDMFNEL